MRLDAKASYLQIIREPISRSELQSIAEQGFGDMVKAVVDVTRHVMAVGGELHSDEEAALLDDSSFQRDLWGVNLYLEGSQDDWIEYDSVINLRPSFGNRSRGVDDAELRERIRRIVESLVVE